MQNPLLAIALVATFGFFSASAFAMTKDDYKVEKARLTEAYSKQHTDCLQYAGRERSACDAKIRSEKSIAMDKLDATFKATETSSSKP